MAVSLACITVQSEAFHTADPSTAPPLIDSEHWVNTRGCLVRLRVNITPMPPSPGSLVQLTNRYHVATSNIKNIKISVLNKPEVKHYRSILP